MAQYEAEPCYPAAGGTVISGWPGIIALIPPGSVVAVEGPMLTDWDGLLAGLRGLAGQVDLVDMREHCVDWEQVQTRTASVEQLTDDPDFATLASACVRDLFDDLPPAPSGASGASIVFGPGAALVEHQVLWYLDRPKRFAEADTVAGRGRNLGQRGDQGATTKRLFYIDWPMLDRHREQLADQIDLWIDTRDLQQPKAIAGPDLRATLRGLSQRPFRTRPTFNTTPWGGHWAQQQLSMNTDAPNTALGYELIAPESGILIGDASAAAVEVPFQLLVGSHPQALLGGQVHEMFGTSFPIRFDYLDTFGGGSLSVHCHPQPAYMQEIFGWPYTQHETYYMMVGGDENVVYLGLHGDADVDDFQEQAHRAAHHGVEFDIMHFVQSHPAQQHQLFLIPAGTPHGSGKDNVVLEISATPYLYSLRFYDWLRQGSNQRQRPVHVDHAFANLDTTRAGQAVQETLIPKPRTIATGPGWDEEIIGQLPNMFFQVHRLELQPGAQVTQSTQGRFHVLNVVAGQSVLIVTELAEHVLSFAETIVIPASVGSYRIVGTGDEPTRVVKAFVT